MKKKTNMTFKRELNSSIILNNVNSYAIWQALTPAELGFSRWEVSKDLHSKPIFCGTQAECKKFIREKQNELDNAVKLLSV